MISKITSSTSTEGNTVMVLLIALSVGAVAAFLLFRRRVKKGSKR
jgi:LPXTG-motif cell wall-anchored protein